MKKYSDKQQTIGFLIIILVFIVALMIGKASVKQEITPANLEQYKAGFTDGMINEITKLIWLCIPDNVEVFRGVDGLGRQWGLIYVCPNNSTYTFDQNESMIMVRYSKE